MFQRISRTFLVAVVATAAAVAADEPKCTATARECEQQIRQVLSGRRFLGVTVAVHEERTPGGLGGLTVIGIVENSPAERAGVKVGDRLIAVNGKSLVKGTAMQFKQIVGDARSNGRIWMIILRQGAYKKIETRLEPYSKEQIDKIVQQHLMKSHPPLPAGQ